MYSGLCSVSRYRYVVTVLLLYSTINLKYMGATRSTTLALAAAGPMAGPAITRVCGGLHCDATEQQPSFFLLQ